MIDAEASASSAVGPLGPESALERTLTERGRCRRRCCSGSSGRRRHRHRARRRLLDRSPPGRTTEDGVAVEARVRPRSAARRAVAEQIRRPPRSPGRCRRSCIGYGCGMEVVRLALLPSMELASTASVLPPGDEDATTVDEALLLGKRPSRCSRSPASAQAPTPRLPRRRCRHRPTRDGRCKVVADGCSDRGHTSSPSCRSLQRRRTRAEQGTLPGQVALTLEVECAGVERPPVTASFTSVTVEPGNASTPPPSAVESA